MIVDCGIYDARRPPAPGTFTFEEAFEASKAPGTYVWLGLYEPTAGGVRVGEVRVRAPRARRRGRAEGPPAAQARGLRRHAVPRGQDGPLRGPRGGRDARRDPPLRRSELRRRPSGTARRARSPRPASSIEKRPELLACGPGARPLGDRRPRRRRLPAGPRRASSTTSTRSRTRCSRRRSRTRPSGSTSSSAS